MKNFIQFFIFSLCLTFLNVASAQVSGLPDWDSGSATEPTIEPELTFGNPSGCCYKCEYGVVTAVEFVISEGACKEGWDFIAAPQGAYTCDGVVKVGDKDICNSYYDPTGGSDDLGCCYQCVDGKVKNLTPNRPKDGCPSEGEWFWKQNLAGTCNMTEGNYCIGNDKPADTPSSGDPSSDPSSDPSGKEKLGCCIQCEVVTEAVGAEIVDIIPNRKKDGCPKLDWWHWIENDSWGSCKYEKGDVAPCSPIFWEDSDVSNGGNAENRSVSKYKELKLQIYPTTSDGLFTIELENMQPQDIFIEIIDMSGQLVYGHTSFALKGKYQHQVDLSNQACTGMYIVKVQVGKEILTEKVFIR